MRQVELMGLYQIMNHYLEKQNSDVAHEYRVKGYVLKPSITENWRFRTKIKVVISCQKSILKWIYTNCIHRKIHKKAQEQTMKKWFALNEKTISQKFYTSDIYIFIDIMSESKEVCSLRRGLPKQAFLS